MEDIVGNPERDIVGWINREFDNGFHINDSATKFYQESTADTSLEFKESDGLLYLLALGLNALTE